MITCPHCHSLIPLSELRILQLSRMTKGKVKEASDYYGVAANQVIVAFGSEMRARTSGAQSRFGFNGKKKIDEITNIQGSDYDFDFLINRKEISEVCGTGEGYTCNEKITIKSVKDIVLINVQEYFKNDSSGHVIPGTYKKIISKWWIFSMVTVDSSKFHDRPYLGLCIFLN